VLAIGKDAAATDADVSAFAQDMEQRLTEIGDLQDALDALQISDQAELEAIVEAAAALDRQIEKLTEHCHESLTALFGHRFPLTFEFELPADHPLAASHEAGIGTADAQAWMHRLGRIHAALGDWELASMVSQAQGGAQSVSQLAPTQTPWTDGTPWIGGQLTAEALKGGVHSVVFAGEVQFGQPCAGLMLAAFNEALPRETEQGGLAFQYDRPSAEPPQAVLLAVAPDPIGTPHWDQDTLFQVLAEALDLARIRMVDPDSMRGFGSLLPAMYLTYNPGDQAISTLLIDEEDVPGPWLGGSQAAVRGES
jgi:hypothetical protein